MPVYQYQCSICNFRFELKQNFDDGTTAPCPECQGIAQRLLAPVPIIFKGPGFYVTDTALERERREGKKTKEIGNKED